ncbi:hypothetical protein Acr_07g0007320 [Actinidia rufa]|uniref:Pectinesterase inhibitor domain-containing protein n=1 Tax=Actinidia rufa TaxID=165716 RepID=A0A7J0EVQ9_9ERIC|nr:hypothetical protein Acr_07g0007320 [Actinidia rufa]
MVVAVTIGVNQNTGGLNHSRQEVTTSMKAIKNICEPTDYKQVCVESLTCSAGNTTDPKELIRAAFQVAKEKIQEAARNSTLLQKLHKDPRTNEALRNCEVLAEAATNDLERSFDQMGQIDASKFDNLLANLKTWLSGAITYQETCLDGFENTTGDAGEKMKGYLTTGMQLTSNGLAMVTEISAALSSMNIQGFNNRRLLSHELPILGHNEFPTWVNTGTRKLLAAGSATLKPDLVVAKDGFIFPPPPDRSNASHSRADAWENSSTASLPVPQVVTPTTAPPPLTTSRDSYRSPPTSTQTAPPAPSPTSSKHKRGLFGMFF